MSRAPTVSTLHKINGRCFIFSPFPFPSSSALSAIRLFNKARGGTGTPPLSAASVSVGAKCGSRRRELLFLAASAALDFPTVALSAETDFPEDFRVYTDEVNKFKITIPQDWQVGSGEGDGVRSLTAFYPPEASSSNVSIVITSLGADFTRLESFGKVDAFAENLIGGLDRSWQRPPGVAAKLIDTKSANGLYYIEYTL